MDLLDVQIANEKKAKRNEKARQKRKELKKAKEFEKQVKEANKVTKSAKVVNIRNKAYKAKLESNDIVHKFQYSSEDAGRVIYSLNQDRQELRSNNINYNVAILEYHPMDRNMEEKVETHFCGRLYKTSWKSLRLTIGQTLYWIHNKYAQEIMESADTISTNILETLETVNIKLCIIPDVKPMAYIHALKDGEVFNCFLKQMKAWAIINDDKKTFEKVNQLNGKYFNDGVKFEDIQDICNKVHCNVEIFNKLDDKLFECKYSTGKYKTFKYVITKNDHVETYIEDMFNVSSKTIEYVEDVDEAFFLCDASWKCYTKTKEGKLVYFFTTDKVYKQCSTAHFDEGKYYINDIFDLENIKFNEKYELDRNVMIMNRDEDLFKFVNGANHYVYEMYFTENIDDKYITKAEPEWDDIEGDYIEPEADDLTVDLSEYYAYDQNKNYMSYKESKYYNQYLFPKTGNFEFYRVEDDFTDYDKVVSKTGFVQINNINYSSCVHNTKRILERINYFRNGGVYATPAVKCLIDMGATFKIEAVAFTNWTYQIDFSDEIITNKFYNKIVGMMDIKGDHRIIKTVYNDITELQDLLYASSDKVTFYCGNELWFKLPKTCVKNNCHISAYVLTYAFLGILEKLLEVQYDDIIGVKVDCVITKKNYDHVFKLGKNIGQWKRETKTTKIIYDCGFINDIEQTTTKPSMKLTDYKLEYKKLNFITGEAGAGKTTRYVSTFGQSCEVDERVYNFLMCFPNNNLKNEFNKKFECPTSTYHKAFRVGSDGEDNDGIKLKYYANAILDEASMISLAHFEHIVKEAEKYCVNLHVVGDYDMKIKKLYQLTPPEGTPFTQFDFHGLDEDEEYYLHLKENYRQGDDKEFTEFLRSCRGQTNKQIIEKLKTYKGFTNIKVNDIPKFYNDGDVVLCSTNDYVDKINDMLKQRSTIQIKYKKTTRHHAKNEMAIVSKEEFDASSMELAFSITNHLCQGLEYTNNIFIIMDRLFEDNMLYVCLSRAKRAGQVHLVYVPQGSKVCSVDTNIKKKLNKYRNHDKTKGFTFDLDVEHVSMLRTQQQGKCKHCNVDMLFENYAPFSMKQFSVDRIDDSQGHYKGNVVLSCFGCNCRHRKTGSIEEKPITKEYINDLVKKINPSREKKLVGYALYNIGHDHNIDLETVYDKFTGFSSKWSRFWGELKYYPGGLNIGSLVMWANEDAKEDSKDK